MPEWCVISTWWAGMRWRLLPANISQGDLMSRIDYRFPDDFGYCTTSQVSLSMLVKLAKQLYVQNEDLPGWVEIPTCDG